MALEGYRFKHTLRVRYAEIDGQKIVFNGVYMTYLDVAITEYFRALGWSLEKLEAEAQFDFAVVKATLEYRRPAFFDDLLDVYARVAAIGRSSFTVEFAIVRQATGERVLDAAIVYVGYDMHARTSRPVPPLVRARMAEFEGRPELAGP